MLLLREFCVDVGWSRAQILVSLSYALSIDIRLFLAELSAFDLPELPGLILFFSCFIACFDRLARWSLARFRVSIKVRSLLPIYCAFVWVYSFPLLLRWVVCVVCVGSPSHGST